MNELVLDAWERQCRIVTAVAGRVDESTRSALPSPDGWTLDHHLAHIHKVRQHCLSGFDPARAAALDDAFTGGWEAPIADLDEIRACLRASGEAVRVAAREATGPAGGYDNPVLLLQHLTWHEGWHVGLIMLGLRLAGAEPTEEWEFARIWGEWWTEPA